MEILKKIFVMVAFIFQTIFSACGTAEKVYPSGNDSLPEPEYENPVVFVYVYQNWAWGYQCAGSFVDLNGDVYSFDFSDRDPMKDPEPMDDKDLIEELIKIRDTEEPVRQVDADEIEACYRKIDDIDISAEVSSESVACDAGQHTLYIADGYELIMLSSDGDYQKIKEDKTAKKLARKYERIMKTD